MYCRAVLCSSKAVPKALDRVTRNKFMSNEAVWIAIVILNWPQTELD